MAEEKDEYLGRVVQKLYRKYSKDELIRYYKNELSERLLEGGKDAAYIDELEHEITQQKARINVLQAETEAMRTLQKETIREIKSEELYKQLLSWNKKLTEKNKKLEASNAELIYKLNQKNKNDASQK